MSVTAAVHRVPTVLVTKNSRTFQDPRSIFQYHVDSQQCLNIETNSSYKPHIWYDSSTQVEYMLITVACREEIDLAKKLFKHSFFYNCRGVRSRPHHCIRRLHHCLAISRTFQVLEILQTQFRDFRGNRVRGLRLPVADDVVRGVVDKQQRRCSRRVVLEYDANVVLLDDTLHQDAAVLPARTQSQCQ